jgi:hypothetical protein
VGLLALSGAEILVVEMQAAGDGCGGGNDGGLEAVVSVLSRAAKLIQAKGERHDGRCDRRPCRAVLGLPALTYLDIRKRAQFVRTWQQIVSSR